MTAKRPFFFILLISALLLILNLYLINKDHSKVSRSFYVNDWEKVRIEDMIQSVETSGVTAPKEKHQVYFDEHQGFFKQFLVEKGEVVQSGTPLYEYEVAKKSEDQEHLQAKIDQLEEEISSVEKHIEKLANMDTPDEDYFVELEITNSHFKRDMMEAELKAYESQLQTLNDRPTTITVRSDFSGTVKERSENLDDPLLTIVSENMIVKGVLRESDVQAIEEGMKVSITSDLVTEKMEGEVGQIDLLPEEEPSLKKESSYPLTVVFNEPADELKLGYHVNLAIVIAEVPEALVIPERMVRQNGDTAYVASLSNGQLVKKEVTTGLKVGETLEIVEGLAEDEVVVKTRFNKEGATVFTPVKLESINRSLFQQIKKTAWHKHILVGLLS